jgi:hypothetical protein
MGSGLFSGEIATELALNVLFSGRFGAVFQSVNPIIGTRTVYAFTTDDTSPNGLVAAGTLDNFRQFLAERVVRSGIR